MTHQNVTLALPKDVLREAKALAVRRHTSISRLLTQAIEELVRADDAYARAKVRFEARLSQTFDLGTGGQVRTTREELHERG